MVPPDMGYSLRKAINEKCKDCIYDPLSGLGTWKQQTEGCPDESCSLWPVRPKSSAKSQTNGDSEADDDNDDSGPQSVDGDTTDP